MTDSATPSPAADHPQLPALAIVKTSGFVRAFARVLVAAFFILLVAIAFLPWRQFVSGHGRVIAFNPLDRRINIEAQVNGRVRALHIVEGQSVKKDQIIAEIQDNDPNLLKNLQAQSAAIRMRRELAKERVGTIDSQIAQQELGKIQAVDGATQRRDAARYAADTAALQFTRITALAAKGLSSTRDLELATLTRDSSAAALKAAEAALAGTATSYDASVAAIRAQQVSARSDVTTAERDLAAMEVQISQMSNQVVKAPRAGTVFQITATDGTYLRPGSPICVIIPETDSRFVEIWVDGNDAPLVQPRKVVNGKTVKEGSPVRIAFSGWPAVQAIGWPNAAVGTFGGEVVFVDATDNGKGEFRVVVAEKPDVVQKDGKKTEIPWPDRNIWLRQGTRANGWVMLKQVPLWYELWRKANGFPPVVENYGDSKGEKKGGY
jgi:adhesin transport system membrane fusion protein